MATIRTRGRSGNNVLLLLRAIGLAFVVFCAASTTTSAAAASAAAKTPAQMLTMMMNDEAAADESAAAAKAAGLSVDFHAAGCPELHDIVGSAVAEARRGEMGLAVTPGLLRIFFHDCFPQGCDASLLLNDTGASEQNTPQNGGLQQVALTLVETIRGRVHGQCGPTVSCADILALATSHAVAQAGGPFIPMELGRSDSRGPSPQTTGLLPSPTSNFETLNQSFSDRSLNAFDVVALSGAHTMGMARCSSFQDRIDKQNENKDEFEKELTAYCSGNGEKKHVFDSTPFQFDNNYFVELQNGRGLLTSDQALYRDEHTGWLVDRYVNNQDEFFNAFTASMLKLSRLPGSNPGPVRQNCFRSSVGGSDGTNLLVLDTTTDDDEDPAAVLAAAA